ILCPAALRTADPGASGATAPGGHLQRRSRQTQPARHHAALPRPGAGAPQRDPRAPALPTPRPGRLDGGGEWRALLAVRDAPKRSADPHRPAGGVASRRAEVAHPLDGFGFVVPRSERKALVACSFSNVKFPGRAPEGTVLLRAFLDGKSAEGTDHATLERIVRDDLRDILGITSRPLLVRSFVHRRAMAQYEVDHLERVAAVEERLVSHPGLALAGHGLRGGGLLCRARGGEAAADRVAAQAGVVSLAR